MRPSRSAGLSNFLVLSVVCCVCLTNANASTKAVDYEGCHGFRRLWKRDLSRGKAVVEGVIEKSKSARGRDEMAEIPSSQGGSEPLAIMTRSKSRSRSRSASIASEPRPKRKKASRPSRGDRGIARGGEEQRRSEDDEQGSGSAKRAALHEPLLQLREIAEQAMSGSGGQPEKLPLVHQSVSAHTEVVPEAQTGSDARRSPIAINIPIDFQTPPASGPLLNPTIDPRAQSRDTTYHSPLSVTRGKDNIAHHGTSSSSMSKEGEVQSVPNKPKAREPRPRLASARDPRSTSVGQGLTMSIEKEDLSTLAPGQVIQGDTSTSASGNQPGSTDLTLRTAASNDRNVGEDRSQSTPIEVAGENEALSQSSPGLQGVRPLSTSRTDSSLGGLGLSALDKLPIQVPEYSSQYANKTPTSPGLGQPSPGREMGSVGDSGLRRSSESIKNSEGSESEQERKRKRPMQALPGEAGHSGELSANEPHRSSEIGRPALSGKVTAQALDLYVAELKTAYRTLATKGKLFSDTAEQREQEEKVFQEHLAVVARRSKYEVQRAVEQTSPDQHPEQDNFDHAIKYFEEKLKVRYPYPDDLPDAPTRIKASGEHLGTSTEKPRRDSPHPERRPRPEFGERASVEKMQPPSSAPAAPGYLGRPEEGINTGEEKQRMDSRFAEDAPVAQHGISHAEHFALPKGSQFEKPLPAKSVALEPMGKSISAESSETSTGNQRGASLPSQINPNIASDTSAPAREHNRPLPFESIETFEPRLWDVWMSEWFNSISPAEQGIVAFYPEATAVIKERYNQLLFNEYQKGREPSFGGKNLTPNDSNKMRDEFLEVSAMAQSHLPEFIGRKSTEFEESHYDTNPIIYISDSPIRSGSSQSNKPPTHQKDTSEEEIFRHRMERMVQRKPSQAPGGQQASISEKVTDPQGHIQQPKVVRETFRQKFERVSNYISTTNAEGKAFIEKHYDFLISKIEEMESNQAVPVLRESHSATNIQKDASNQASKHSYGTSLPGPHGVPQSVTQSPRAPATQGPMDFVPQSSGVPGPQGSSLFAQQGPRVPAPWGPRLPIKPLSIGVSGQHPRTQLLQTPRNPLTPTPRGPVQQGTPKPVSQILQAQGSDTPGLQTPKHPPSTKDEVLTQQISLAEKFLQMKSTSGSPRPSQRILMEAQQLRNQNPEEFQRLIHLLSRKTQGGIHSPAGSALPPHLNVPSQISPPPSNMSPGSQQLTHGPVMQHPNVMRPHSFLSQATDMQFGNRYQRTGTIVQPVGYHMFSQNTNPASMPHGNPHQQTSSIIFPSDLQRSSQIKSQAASIPLGSQPSPAGQIPQMSSHEFFQMFNHEALRNLYAAQQTTSPQPTSGVIAQKLSQDQLLKFLKEAEQQNKKG